jgi:ATP-dependent Clp protease ATP-binding subunit ClpC
MLNHNYIGTEHILLGLIREGQGNAATALESLNISLEAVRREVEEIIGRGLAPPTGYFPYTPRAKKVFEVALRAALELSNSLVGTQHILLGLIREGEGVAAQILQKLGADMVSVRQTVMEGLRGQVAGPVGTFRQEGPELDEPPSPFRERERIVLELIDSGMTTMEIADVFEWPRTTVDEIVEAVVAKLREILLEGKDG